MFSLACLDGCQMGGRVGPKRDILTGVFNVGLLKLRLVLLLVNRVCGERGSAQPIQHKQGRGGDVVLLGM